MSAPALVGSLLSPLSPTRPSSPRFPRSAADVSVSRRPDPVRGRSLEILGHAIEYLADTRMEESEQGTWGHDMDAIQLLARLNREVFKSAPSSSRQGKG